MKYHSHMFNSKRLAMSVLVAATATSPASAFADGSAAAMVSTANASPATTQDDAVCSGPWFYESVVCHKLARRPECGVAEPAVWAEVVPKASCRREEFGLEHFRLQQEHPFARMDRVNGVNLCAKNNALYARQVEEATAQCEQDFTLMARQHLHPTAFARCASPHVECSFGGANTYITIRMTAMMMAPTWTARENHPSCPAIGPGEPRLVRPAVYRNCRHPQNGDAPPSECDGLPSLLQSRPGLRRGDLIAEGRAPVEAALAHCSTCDAGTHPGQATWAECHAVSQAIWSRGPGQAP